MNDESASLDMQIFKQSHIYCTMHTRTPGDRPIQDPFLKMDLLLVVSMRVFIVKIQY